MSISRLPLALGFVLAAPFVSAATPVGHWTGKISIVMPPMPANVPPAQKAQITKFTAQLAAARIQLDIKADKTYSATTTGMPMAPAGQKETGKWSQKGSIVTMTDNKKAGQTQNLTLSPNGKTMTLALPGGRGKIVFSK